ncbi:MAG: class I SAM-dependent methyltransferase [Flavobacteriales bacterium]|nr:class I SAM-dependent methyltransferase [Flavobacteriales bacterium]
MPEFEHNPIDKPGHDTLDVIASADKLNRWIYDTIAPHCSGKILEIGSGIGNISQCFINAGATIMLSDIRDSYCEILREKFAGNTNVLGIKNINLTDGDFENKFSSLLNSFDSVFAINVVEHIQDDSLAILNAYKLLKTRGKLIILVPAYQTLYNGFDKELEHYRRYTQKTLRKKLEQHFEVIHSKYFNAAGIAGWFVSGSLLKKKTIPEGQLSFYNKLVPTFKVVDKVLFNRIGLSVVQVGMKK